jgi:flagellin
MSVINTNIKSLVAQDALNINNRKLSTTMERLSTGSRINSAADDAAGLSISTRMESQVRGLQMAVKNAYDAISVTETAEGAMEEVTNILQRMRELSVQAASDSNSAEDRGFLNDEIKQLSAEIDRISQTTQFNGMNVLDGSFSQKVFQIGANSGQTMNLSIGSMSAGVLGVAASEGVTTQTSRTTVASGVSEANALGAPATETVAKIRLNDEKWDTEWTSSTLTFTLTDSNGSSIAIAGVTVDLSSDLSRASFVSQVNSAIQAEHIDTTITGTTTTSASETLDISDSANFDKLRFDVRVDGGDTVSIDLRSRLLSTNGVTDTAVTRAQLAQAVEDELVEKFDADLSADVSGTALEITDAQGRRLEVSQGLGSGFLFGTDSDNGGSLLARESARNNLSIEWESDETDVLVLRESTGGKIALTAFAAGNTDVRAVFESDQVEGTNEPILLHATATNETHRLDALTFAAPVEETKIGIIFDDAASAGTSYAFKITDGSGNVWADFSAIPLDVGDNTDNSATATIRADVLAALSAGIGANFGADNTIDMSEFDVQVDKGTVIITNTNGRAMQVVNSDASVSAGAGNNISVVNLNEFSGAEYLYSASSAGTVNNFNEISAPIAKGETYAATQVTLTMSEDKASFNFALNGTDLDDADQTAWTATDGYVIWDSTENFETSDLKVKLDALMDELNTVHAPGTFEYAVSGRSITFFQRDGGPIEISEFRLDKEYRDVTFAVTPAAGQGESATLYDDTHFVSAAATASGTGAIETSAALTFGGDDVFSLTISDGENAYEVGPNVLDVGNVDSAESFVRAVERALVGSGIEASMGSNGTLLLSRQDGGAISITSFSSVGKTGATWTPAAGQGDAYSLAGNGRVAGATVTTVGSSGSSTGGGADFPVSEVSVETQEDATAALSVLDAAISYVNAERSKLGAVQNRLTHTIDNLSNVVTATQASRSRIQDTDYAKETAELARAQIIQQAATAMLAQANQQPQSVLALLQ